jgi:hypothetical protein
MILPQVAWCGRLINLGPKRQSKQILCMWFIDEIDDLEA